MRSKKRWLFEPKRRWAHGCRDDRIALNAWAPPGIRSGPSVWTDAYAYVVSSVRPSASDTELHAHLVRAVGKEDVGVARQVGIEALSMVSLKSLVP